MSEITRTYLNLYEMKYRRNGSSDVPSVYILVSSKDIENNMELIKTAVLSMANNETPIGDDEEIVVEGVTFVSGSILRHSKEGSEAVGRAQIFKQEKS